MTKNRLIIHQACKIIRDRMIEQGIDMSLIGEIIEHDKLKQAVDILVSWMKADALCINGKHVDNSGQARPYH